MPSNFAVALNVGASVRFASQSNIVSATSLYWRAKVKGTALDVGSTQSALCDVGKSDGTAAKFAVWVNRIFSPTHYIAIGDGSTTATPTSFDVGDIDPTAWYVIYAHWDPSASSYQSCTIFTEDGAVFATGGSVSSASGLSTAASNGAISINNTWGIFPGTSDAAEYDWMALGSGSLSGSARFTQPTSSDTNILSGAYFDEGTGTTAGNFVGGANSGTIAGTFSWDDLGSPADHGTITLTPSEVAIGGTGTATVAWYDASNILLSPQPTNTRWTALTAGATIDSSTGAFTGVAGGLATLRARSGTVIATANLTITRRVTFSGSITVT